MKKIEFTQEQLQSMVKMHNDGMLNKDIAKVFNTSLSTINRRLRELNVLSRHPLLSQERKDKAIELYSKYHNISKVEKELHMNSKTITEILNEVGVYIYTNSEVNRDYHINEHFFDNINTSKKSYYLGLLYADGCVCSNSNHIQLSLQEQDYDIIEKFRNDIESNHVIRFIDYKKKHPTWSNQYNITITSNYLKQSLIDKGVVPNKSLILTFPDFLSEDLYPSFILGYMDGDGSITKTECRLKITSTESFCKRVADIFKNTLGVNSSILYCHGRKDRPTRDLQVAGRNQVKKVLDWLYSNCDVYLNRKHQIYLDKYCS